MDLLICPQCGGQITDYSPLAISAKCGYCSSVFRFEKLRADAPREWEPDDDFKYLTGYGKGESQDAGEPVDSEEPLDSEKAEEQAETDLLKGESAYLKAEAAFGNRFLGMFIATCVIAFIIFLTWLLAHN